MLMQTASRRKPHSPPGSGSSHHVCHSCGWTFSNPHPSAKQRRAHRKHCGMIEGFLLVSSYAGEDGGGDVNNSVGDVIPSAEHANGAAVLAVELKDALSRSLMESPNSLAGTPEMEGENMNTRCANGDLVSILVSAGCHGGEAIVETHSANSDDLSVATKAPGGDFKVSALVHDKKIQNVDAENLKAQLEKDCHGNEMCSEVGQQVLDEFSVEMNGVPEEINNVKNNIYGEALSVNGSASDYCMYSELKLLSKDSCLGSSLSQKMENAGNVENEIENAPLLSFQDVLTNTSEVGHLDNMFGGYVNGNRVKSGSSSYQTPQDVLEDYSSETNHGEEQILSPQPVVVLEDSIGQFDFSCTQPGKALHESRKEFIPKNMLNLCKHGQADTAESDDILTESTKEAFLKINHYEYQRMEEPKISMETGLTKSERYPDCIVVSDIKGIQLETTSVELGQIKNFLSSGQTQMVSFKFKEKESNTKEVTSDDASGESHFSIENNESSKHSVSGEIIALPITTADLSLSNKVNFVEESFTVDEKKEYGSGKKASFPVADCHVNPDETVKDGSTGSAPSLLMKTNGERNDSCIIVNLDSEDDQDVVMVPEIMTPNLEVEITKLKSLHVQNHGDNKIQDFMGMTEYLSVADVACQPCVHGSVHMNAWIGSSLSIGSNQQEVECCQSHSGSDTCSCTVERNHLSEVELCNDRVEKELLLVHAAPMLGSSKLVADHSKNKECGLCVYSLNLHKENDQSGGHENLAEYIHDIMVSETDIPIQPKEGENTAFECQKHISEGKLTQNNEEQLYQECMDIPAIDSLVSPPEMLSKVQISDVMSPFVNEEIASFGCLKYEEQANIKVGEDEIIHPQIVKETTNPETTSNILVDLHGDLQVNEVLRNVKIIASSALFSEYSPVRCSEGESSIKLESWIDYGAHEDSAQTDNLHSDVEFQMKRLDTDTELENSFRSPDGSRSSTADSFNIMESLPSMPNLDVQGISKSATHENSRESAGGSNKYNVITKTHSHTERDNRYTILSEKPSNENKDDWNNEELLGHPHVDIPKRGTIICPLNMLSGEQSSMSLEELKINGAGEVASGIKFNIFAEDPTLNQKDSVTSLALGDLMDSFSRTDSMQGQWSSISVLSANDVASLQDMEIETLTEVIPLRLGGLDATTFTKADAFEEQCIKVDYPSMSSNLAIMEENEWLLEGTANGAFPNKQCTFESKERRTRQDIIAKVESWNSCKQHTQLKTLLVEANDSMKNIPMHQAPTRITRNHVPEKDGPIKGFPAASISEHFVDACAKDEAQKEWNSPARLPSSRNDKRKIKSKPHWVPFLCCPSLH